MTSKLLELQQKHREISEKVQSVLVDTVDFAFGAKKSHSLREAMKSINSQSSSAKMLKKNSSIFTAELNEKKE